MDASCNDAISAFELLGRILYETPQISKNGNVRQGALYPRIREDEERPGKFTNKVSFVRICRGHNRDFSWDVHVYNAERFIKKTKMSFKGFLIARVSKIRNFGFDVQVAATPNNPYHVHMVIPDYDIDFNPNVQMISDILPNKIKVRLDRLRESALPPVLISRNSDKYSQPPCERCII